MRFTRALLLPLPVALLVACAPVPEPGTWSAVSDSGRTQAVQARILDAKLAGASWRGAVSDVTVTDWIVSAKLSSKRSLAETGAVARDLCQALAAVVDDPANQSLGVHTINIYQDTGPLILHRATPLDRC